MRDHALVFIMCTRSVLFSRILQHIRVLWVIHPPFLLLLYTRSRPIFMMRTRASRRMCIMIAIVPLLNLIAQLRLSPSCSNLSITLPANINITSKERKPVSSVEP